MARLWRPVLLADAAACCRMQLHAAACLLHAAACQRHPRGRWRCPMAGFGRFGGRLARLWRPVLLADAAACCRMQLHAAACCCMQPRASDTREADGAVLWWQVGEAVEACATGGCCCMQPRASDTREADGAVQWQVLDALVAGWRGCGGLCYWRMLLHAAAYSCMLLHAAACSRVPADTREADGAVQWQVLDAWWQVGEAVEACATGGCCCMLPHAAVCCCMLLHAAACQRHPRGRWRCPMAGFGRFGGRLARLWRPVLLADAAACCRMQLHAAACCMQPRASDSREADGAVQWQGFGRFGGRLARLWRPVLLATASPTCHQSVQNLPLDSAICLSGVGAVQWQVLDAFGGRLARLWRPVLLADAAACCCMQPRASDTREADGAVQWQVLDALVAGWRGCGGLCYWRMLQHAAACSCMLLHAAACSRVPATPERQMALSNGRFWTLWWQVGEAVEACATGGCCCMLPHAAACCCMLLHAAACQRHPRGRWRCPMAGFGRVGGRLARLWRPVLLADAAACCRMQLHAAACCCMQPRASDTREADGAVQ